VWASLARDYPVAGEVAYFPPSSRPNPRRRNPTPFLEDIVFTGPHAGSFREQDIRFVAEAPNPRHDPEEYYVIRGKKQWWVKPTYTVGSIEISRDPDGTFSVGTVAVDPEYQRKGIAKRLYDMAWQYAKTQGSGLRSGWVQSPRAVAYWESMVEAGNAEPYTDGGVQYNVTKKGWRRTRNPRRRNPSVFDTLTPGTPNAVREQLQRLSRDDLARLQDELTALDDASIARFTGMTRLWHGAPASIADKIRERGFARTKGRRSGFMGSTFEVDNLALFLTENKALAEAFGRSRSGRGEGTEVLEVYADLRQPLDLTVWAKVPKSLRALGEKLLAAHGGSKKPKQEDVFWLIDQPAFMDAVRDLGYDAVRFYESAETVKSLGLARKGEVTVAVLDPARLHVAPPPRGTLGSLLWHLDRSRK
jgi:GNAT superfamily N-acetyltransferase